MNRLTTALAIIDADTAADPLQAAKARGLMTGYHAAYQAEADRYEPFALEDAKGGIEAEFSLPILNPETGRKVTPFRFAGRVDGLVKDRQSGRLYLLEHKTTSDNLHGGSAYWQRLTIDTQISLYALALHELGVKIDGILYDVISKPGIKPKQIAAKERLAAIASGHYYGYPISDDCLHHLKVFDKPGETHALYASRLAADTIADADSYYGRRLIVRTERELLEAAYTLRDIALTIHDARKRGRFIKNTFQCLSNFGACPFLAACCSGEASEELYRPRKSVDEHAKSYNQLSHSKMEVWAKCQRLFQWQYEQNLEPSRERSDALSFGDLMHRALAAWWDYEPGKTREAAA